MFNQKRGIAAFGVRGIVVIACVLLIGVLIGSAVLVACMDSTGSLLSREEITARMEELGQDDRGHAYVANHIMEYGIGGFDAGKFRNVEFYFGSKYVGDLPSVPEMAYTTAELFMTYYYDRLDHGNKDAVTTALVKCYVEATGDRYAVYRTPEELEQYSGEMSGEFVGIGVQVMQELDPATGKLASVRVEEVFNGSGAEGGGIEYGDYIVAVDGVDITTLESSEMLSMIKGEEGTFVEITVLRGEERIGCTCKRALVVDLSVEYSIENSIGFIEISSFKANTAELFAEALEYMYTNNVVGIVFDVRSNPGGYLEAVLSVLDSIVPGGVDLASYVEASGATTVYKSTGEGAALSVPCVVLCNEGTASAGELFTAALRDFDEMGIIDATVVGTTTFGKGVMQRVFSFFDGSSITLTVAYYNPPSGVNYEGKGITPDVTVELDEDSDTDTQMNTAINTLADMITGASSSGNGQNNL